VTPSGGRETIASGVTARLIADAAADCFVTTTAMSFQNAETNARLMAGSSRGKMGNNCGSRAGPHVVVVVVVVVVGVVVIVVAVHD